MKRKILFVLILAVLFSACKMKLSENIGTVIIDLRNDLRAVGENGLPVLKDSELTIKVTKIDESYNESDIKGETFAPGNPNKTLSLTLPVGEKIKVRVRVKNVTAQWYGESAVHTVTEGSNTISVKLKKSAAALNSLLFGTDKSHSGGHHDYTLTLNIGSKEIKKENIRYHNFCRDNKGRTYLAYQEGNDYKLERYTSEGDKEDKNFTLPEHCHRLMLASDHKTGKVYLVAEIRGVMKLYRINEDGTHTELTGDPIGYTTGYAVYNNVVVASDYASGSVQGHVLKMYRVNGDNLSEIPLPVQPNLSEDTKIMLGSFSAPHVRINDLYMTSDSLYVLFSDFSKDREYYSLGGIVKYSYKSAGTISNPKRIGIKESHTAQNGIYATDDNNFYGPVKVIGFDDENLYIADDGVRFEFEKGKPRIKENKNRIATLNKANDSLTFDPANAEWLAKEKLWIKPVANPLVFFSLDKNNRNTLDKLILSNDVSGSAPIDIASNIELDTDNYRNIFYTFDRDNNFYLVTKDKLKKFKKSDNSYSEDSGFNGVYNFESSTEAPQNPAYDIVDEVLYAIGKASGGTEVLMKYDGGSWIGTNPSIDIDAEHLYTVYGGTVYSSDPHEAEININQIGSSTHKKVKFPSETDYKNVYGIFAADDFCYVLLHTRDNKQAAIAYFDVTKIDELASPGSFPTVPVSQMKELSIEGLTKFENIKFTGYRDGKLYIAVDGIKRSAVEGAPKLENINKTVSFNISAKTFDSPVNVPGSITWFREENEWHGTKTLVWKVDTLASGEKHYTYYQLENAGDTLPTETFKPGDGNVSGDNYLTDVFCYDEGGNLYIVEYKGGVGALPKYQICRFELQDDGSYNTSPVIASLYGSVGYSLSDKPTAIAVDTSGNVSSGKNVLYYSYGYKNCFIKRIEWSGDSFTSANFNNLWQIEGPQSTDDYTSFTSLAANQDGLFVGEFLKRVSQDDHKYKIHVKKYPHDSPNYGAPQGTIIIVDEAQQSGGIEESLNALYIQDGVLYGLTTKEFRNEHNGANEPQKASISGKLWKIGKTDFSGDSTLENPLYSSEPKPWPGNDNQWKECGKFAPYRFIAVKPKKLVIASDGFYGWVEGTQKKAAQYNFIWTFELKADGSTGDPNSTDKGTGITFSKELQPTSYFAWE